MDTKSLFGLVNCLSIFVGCAILVALVLIHPTELKAEDNDIFEYFEAEANVSTASRRPQSVRESPVSVEVITKHEIRASGFNNIWDLFRFRAGIDVADARAGDGNRGVVSVRGFAREYVNNLQVLVDGRSVFSSYGGGVYWPQLPVQIQDIEQIEIVRGPNAALWGSNAGLGVINIITTKPGIRETVWAEGQVGDPEAYRGRTGVDFGGNNAALRLSYTHRNEEVFVTRSGDTGEDDIRSDKVNLRGLLSPRSGTTFELFFGGSWAVNTVPRGNEGKFRNGFGMLKLSQDLPGRSTLELMASRSVAYSSIKPITSTLTFGDVDYFQTDVGAVHSFGISNHRYQTTWGVDYRKAEADSALVFENKPAQVNRTVRVFVNESMELSEKVRLILGYALENSDTGDTQSAYQSAIVFSPTEDHTFRVSFSMAPTLPNLYEKGVNHQPSGFARIVGNPDLKPEELNSYEIGYLGSYLAGRAQVKTNLFYMDVENLSASFFTTNPSPPPFGLVSFDNSNEAIARGTEVMLSYVVSPGRSVYANYTYEHITDHAKDIMVEKSTPEHKINFGGIAVLGKGFSGGINVGYKSDYTTIPANRSPSFIVDVPAYWRLDARLSYSPRPDLELAVAGQNLLEPSHEEFSDFDALEVPRTVYASLKLTF